MFGIESRVIGGRSEQAVDALIGRYRPPPAFAPGHRQTCHPRAERTSAWATATFMAEQRSQLGRKAGRCCSKAVMASAWVRSIPMSSSREEAVWVLARQRNGSTSRYRGLHHQTLDVDHDRRLRVGLDGVTGGRQRLPAHHQDKPVLGAVVAEDVRQGDDGVEPNCCNAHTACSRQADAGAGPATRNVAPA